VVVVDELVVSRVVADRGRRLLVTAGGRRRRGLRWLELGELVDASLPERASPESQRFWSYDPVPDLERLQVPLLAVFGARDSFVPVDTTLRLLRGAVARSGNPKVQIVVLPDTAHGLWETQVDSGAAFVRARRYAPTYWSTLGAWLDTQRRPPQPRRQ